MRQNGYTICVGYIGYSLTNLDICVLKLYHKLKKRSTKTAAIISWLWVVPIEDGDRPNTIIIADDILMSRADEMYNLVEHNQLDIGVDGFDLKPGSFEYDESDIICPHGYLGIFRTGTCSPCPTGTIYSEAADDCTTCPHGTYQDEEGQFQCKPCPYGTTSVTEGARMQEECVELCPAGHVSNNGVIPCDACPIGKYQPHSGSTSCISCEHGLTTTSAANTNASSCQSFDVLIEGPIKVSSKDVLQTNTNDLTISVWLETRSTKGSIGIKQPDGTFPLRMHFDKSLSITLLGKYMPGLALSTYSWVHICIVFNHGNQTIVVYKNGEQYTQMHLKSVPTPVFIAGSILEVDLQAQSVITFRSGFVIPFALSSNDVQLLASTCGSKPNDFVIALNDLTGDEDVQQTVKVMIPTTCDAVDECEQGTPCNGHTCINLPGSYKCECQNGFSGLDCSKPPDYCADNSCENGLCVNKIKEYMCVCHDGFKGRLCDEPIVNGGWSAWSHWDQCSHTCGGGTQARSRICDNPVPTDPEGKNCTDLPSEIRSCNTEQCPVCKRSDVRRGIGSNVKCNGSLSALDCVPVCMNPNHVVDITDRLIVRCRNGVWDSKRPTVASCTEVISPSALSIVTRVTLNTGTCLSQLALHETESSINHNIGDLQCSSDASCETFVRAQDGGCNASGRKKRSTGTVVAISLTINIPKGDLQLGEFIASNTVSPQLQKLIDGITVLEKSAQQLKTNLSIFDVNIDGAHYSVLKESLTVASDVQCPIGAVFRNMICVYCTPGTFSDDGKCKFCDLGKYQDESGKSHCKICPSGKTTDFIGSTSLKDCTVYCTPGTFSQNGKCTLCELGTYQDESGRSECKECPSGITTNFTGSTAIQDCSVYCTPGTFSDDGKCELCDLGKYQDESGKSDCKICPSGKTTQFIGSTSLKDCTVYCTPGTFSQNGKCTLCELGTYQDESGRSECKECPSGITTHFTGSTAIQDCSVSLEVMSSTPTNDGLQNQDDDGNGDDSHVTDGPTNDRGQTNTNADVDTIMGATIGPSVCLLIVGVVVFTVYLKRHRDKLGCENIEYQNVYKTEDPFGSDHISKV